MRAAIDCLSSPFRISTCFQFWSDRCMAAAACLTVTIDSGERNQPVPLIPSTPGLIHPAVTRDDDAASRIRIKNSRRCMTRPELDNAHSVCSRAGTRHCENQSKVITVAAQGHPVPSILSAPDNRPQMDFVSRDYETSNLADLAARPAWVPVTKLTASVAHHAMYKDKLLRPSPK